MAVDDAVRVLRSKSYKETHKTFQKWCEDHGYVRGTVYKAAGNYHKWHVHEEIVYFIANEHASAVKVGRTTNLKSRMDSFQIANPTPLCLLGAFKAGLRIEKLIHEKLDSMGARLRGEWFNGPVTVRFMNAIQSQGFRMLTEKDFE